MNYETFNFSIVISLYPAIYKKKLLAEITGFSESTHVKQARELVQVCFKGINENEVLKGPKIPVPVLLLKFNWLIGKLQRNSISWSRSRRLNSSSYNFKCTGTTVYRYFSVRNITGTGSELNLL